MKTFKLQKIDEYLLPEHSCLDTTDSCYFFGEYAGGMGFGHSEMNQLIFNFKKHMDQQGKKGWLFKQKATETIVQLLSSVGGWPEIAKRTWIPIPPSKMKTHPDYDNRIMQVLELLKIKAPSMDIREILLSRNNRESMHVSLNKRFRVDDHLNNLNLDESLINPQPKKIILFDDVITTGATYKACKSILVEKFPNSTLIGIFVARSIKKSKQEANF